MERGMCTWIACMHGVLILVGDTKAASTVYAHLGETATLSWDLPQPGLETFMVNNTYWNQEVFRVTNYRTVTVMNRQPRVKMEFVGAITASGTGVFSFMLHDVTWSDAGHYRCYRNPSNPTAAEVPGCGQTLVVFDFLQPYISAPDTLHLDRSVDLSCYSFTYPDDSVNVSINWRRNGFLVEDTSKYNITQESRAWGWWKRYHRSIFTVSDVRAAKGDNFQCQAVAGQRTVSQWSEEYALVEQSGPYANSTVVREGHNAFITWKMPLVEDVFYVYAPKHILLLEINPTKVYISDAYWSRIKIRKITTSADYVVIQFWLHSTTSEDAGRYYCYKKNQVESVRDCSHILYVQGKPAKPNISVTVSTDKIVFTCETNSSSLPHDHNISMIYTWLRNGHAVENGGRYHFSGHTLAVTDVRQEDLGNYSCQATEEQGLASDWSDTVAPEMLPKPEVQELTVNGTAHKTVKDNQVVVFRCTVEGYPSQVVYLIQESSSATVNMSRKQRNVYEHAMVVRKCSQLGMYFCSTTSVAGTVEEKQHAVVLNGMPQQQASNVFVTYGKPPSVTISLTLCSYPGPSKTKWRFTQSGNLRDITDMTKYHLASKNKKHNVFDYSLVINNIGDGDFGAYIFSVGYNETTFDFFIPACKPLEASLPLVVGCSVGAVIITIVVTAGVILSRLKQFRDYWNLQLRRSYITPMQNVPENIEYRGYAEIDDAGISEHDTDNTMHPVVTIPVDDNIPSASGSRHVRGIETIELSSGRADGVEDGEYEEVRPLQTTSCEARDEQETSAQMQQHDNIEEVFKSEMIMSVPGSSPHSASSIDVTDVSAEGRESGNMVAGIITVFAETSLITHEANETVNAPVINVGMEQLPATMEMYSVMKMEANTTVADETLMEGREDAADIAPDGLTNNRYDSLMPHPPLVSYTALETVGDIMYD
ncbi:uncharacterized protein LOC125381441 [Haliotis rufescens]|uniref:uncharacterized protein LOC125381441 n=1 Tax=Haliotis rufescens TaxID=6454 RepID=UPI00201F4FF7|nr:uncharacterized protein LOC125381441 [Haliotis rufescens]